VRVGQGAGRADGISYLANLSLVPKEPTVGGGQWLQSILALTVQAENDMGGVWVGQ